MRNGIRVFDADAHVIYPPDLWSRFLDPKDRDRVGRKLPVPGFESYNPVTVDGRWSQHDTSLYGQFQKFCNWTYDDQLAKYGDDLVRGGFTGDRVSRALALDGIDMAVIYGPEYDLWFEGIDPEMQASVARAYNRWGAEMRETSGGRVLVSAPVPLLDVSRAVTEIQFAYGNCWISTECEDRFVADVLRWMGDGHILYESDFPHPDSKYPHTTDVFLDLLPDLIPIGSKRKVLWDNALDFYRFPDGYLPATFVDLTETARV